MSRYGSRRIGTYTVGLAVICALETCTVEDEAQVVAWSCEDARQGVMRVLRYRGWQLGKHTEVLCPKHAPAPVACARCEVSTPPFYVRPVGEVPFRAEAVPEIASLPSKAPLCDTCLRWARDLVFAWHREKRAEAAHG